MKKQILFIQRGFRNAAIIQQLVCSRLNAGGIFTRVILSLFIITFFFVTLHAQNCLPNIEWQRSLGGDTTDQGSSIALTSDGGYIVAGYTSSDNGDVSGNHGHQDYWVVKLDANDSLIWQVPLGGSQEDIAHAIVQTTDNGYVIAGSTRSSNGDVTGNHGIHDFWVAKLDVNGSLIWQNALGGSDNDFAYAIDQTSDGGCIVAGISKSIDGDVTGNHGLNDYWVVKLDADGIFEWQKSLGGTHNDEANSIKQTTDGGYIVAGYTASNDGDVTSNQGVTDYWIVKLDATGNLSWQKSFGGPASDAASCVQLTSDGGYIVAGSSSSNSGDVTFNHGFSDFWVVKLNSAGTLLWQKALGGGSLDYGFGIEQTTDGGYVSIGVTGSDDGNITGWHGGRDCWVTKQDASGDLVWQKALGGSADESGSSIKQTVDNGFITAGFSTSNDGDVTGNHGFEDFWVVKISFDVGPVNTYYADVDGDGYGDPLNTIDTTACSPPAGYLTTGTDCDDSNPAINPAGTEICNGLDDNCNVTIDDGIPTLTYYADADDDGYGNENSSVNSCAPPVGFVTDNTDCDDTNAAIHPEGTEICNGLDDDCNAILDDGLPNSTYYADVDNDGYGNANSTVNACVPPVGFISDNTDCDDTNSAIHPGVTEICNGLDDDCNATADDGLTFITYYIDADNDGYGNANVVTTTCTPPVGYVTDNTDCDDTNSAIHPDVTEICNGLDDDCNATADDGLTFITYYIDADDDGYGNANVVTTTCTPLVGYVTDSTDCDDANPDVNPGVLEVSNNGIDDNCNDVIDEFGVGIDEVESNSSFTIYPNPATDMIILELLAESGGQTRPTADAIISITNVLGEIIFERSSSFPNGILHEEISLDKKFTEGVYYVKIRSGEQQWVKPFFVIK